MENNKWKPEIGEVYYAPDLPNSDCVEFKWEGSSIDGALYTAGYVFKTREEAITKAKLMLKALKEAHDVQ